MSKGKPKVLVVATSHLTRGGITSVVCAHKCGPQWDRYHCQWVESHRDGSVLLKMGYLAAGLLRFLWLVPTADLVHLHMSEPPSAKRKMMFMRIAKLFHKKTIVHFHSFSPDTTFRGPAKALYEKIFHSAEIVVALSPMWQRLIVESMPDLANVRVVMNPCTAEPLPEIYPKTRTILFAGALNQRKGYADMLRAFASIAKDFPEWKLVMAGDGEMEAARSLADELGIAAQVEFPGWVRGAAKDRLFKQASVFCLPSYAEGFPMAVLDAWAYGLPVVTTPVGGLPDIVCDGDNALLFPSGDIAALADAFRRIISDEQLRNKIAGNSHKLALTTFSVGNIDAQIGDLYDSLLNNKKKP